MEMSGQLYVRVTVPLEKAPLKLIEQEAGWTASSGLNALEISDI
jgi:hypothetical protein